MEITVATDDPYLSNRDDLHIIQASHFFRNYQMY